jgi:hypothetical protein
MNHYPMLRILVRWGQAIAIALAGLIVMAGIRAAGLWPLVFGPKPPYALHRPRG